MTVTEAPARQSSPELPRLPAERRRGAVGASVAQIVAVEIAVLAVAVALGGAVWLQIVVGVAVLALLLAVFLRRDGRWWYQSVRLRRRFHRRARRAATVTAGVGPVSTDLARLAPDLTITEAVDRRTRFGVGRDADGFFAAVEVLPQPDGDRIAVGLDLLASLLTSSLPVSTLQVVTHLVPAPAGVLDGRAPCMRSYLELLGDASVPAAQRVWVAARLSAADARDAAVSRGGGIPGVRRALAAVLGRLDKALQAAGASAQALDAAQLVGALATVAELPTGAPVSGLDAAGGVEEWRAWRTAEAARVCFAFTELPRRPLAELVAQLSRQQLLSATLSVVLASAGEGEVTVQALLAVSAPPEATEEVVARVTKLCHRAGAVLCRLDGEHGPAVYATAPTGGGA